MIYEFKERLSFGEILVVARYDSETKEWSGQFADNVKSMLTNRIYFDHSQNRPINLLKNPSRIPYALSGSMFWAEEVGKAKVKVE